MNMQTNIKFPVPMQGTNLGEIVDKLNIGAPFGIAIEFVEVGTAYDPKVLRIGLQLHIVNKDGKLVGTIGDKFMLALNDVLNVTDICNAFVIKQY